MSNKEKITIIGAGMAGCFLGLCLAKRGYDIDIYEYRPDVRKVPYDSGRSFNLTLYYRGIVAMQKMDIWKEVKKIAVIAAGNVAHYEKKLVYDPFDGHADEVLYTVHRNQLNSVLLDEVEKLPNVNLHFHTKCKTIDPKSKTITFENTESKKEHTIKTDLVFGADGVNSTVRDALQAVHPGSVVKEYEDWGYKEVHVTTVMAEKLKFRLKATHTWPRPDSLLIAFPNPDDSFTLMFNLPLKGRGSFATLTTEPVITHYITHNFPDLEPLLPEIIDSFLHKPTGSFVTVYTTPWYYKNFMAIIGDAAHGVIPFYGQGVCAAFEDCLTIADLLNEYHENFESVFAKYYAFRKKNTDILARLSKENFIELRDKSRSPFFILKDKTDTLLNRWFPDLWLPPLYVLIAHDTLEYSEAVRKRERQENIAKWSGMNVGLKLLSLPMEAINQIKKST